MHFNVEAHITVVWHLLTDLHMTYSICDLFTDQGIIFSFLSSWGKPQKIPLLIPLRPQAGFED